MEETQVASYRIILPTKQLPPQLKHLSKAPRLQFMVGYRNVLTSKEEKIEWGLVKSGSHCGRAFVFEISEEEAHNIQQIKQSGQYIEIIGNNYILLKIQREIVKQKETLSVQQAQQLFNDIGGVDKISVNLLKNAYDSYPCYHELAEQAVNSLAYKQKNTQLSMGDRVKLEFNAKRLSGKALMEVPSISKQTGNWSNEQTIPLGLSTS